MSLVSEEAADKVAAALNAELGLPVPVTRLRFPKWALADLDGTKINVKVQFPYNCDAHDRASTANDVSLVIAIQDKCEKTDIAKVDELTAIGESIAEWLGLNFIDGVGAPIEPLMVDRIDQVLDKGHFSMWIGATYRVFREAP